MSSMWVRHPFCRVSASEKNSQNGLRLKNPAHVVSKLESSEAKVKTVHKLNIDGLVHTAFSAISSKTKLCTVWFASKKIFSKFICSSSIQHWIILLSTH